MKNKSFLKKLNDYSDSFPKDNDLSNELFLYFGISFKQNQKTNIHKIFESKFYLIFIYFYSLIINFLSAFSLPIFIFFKYKFKRIRIKHKSIIIIRDYASLNKVSFLKEKGVAFLYDSLTLKEFNENSLFNIEITQKFISLIKIPYLCFKDLHKLIIDSHKLFDFSTTTKILFYYKLRLAHKAAFEFYLFNHLKNKNIINYISANKDDRYASTEKRLCKELKIHTIGIPHGLEYSYKLPNGLTGNDFYCTSKKSRDYLEKIYLDKNINFKFDKQLCSKMFSKNKKNSQKIRKIVFFPESREIYKNIKIIKFLNRLKISYYLKLGANDKLHNYLPFIKESMIIEDFTEAISNNYCIARKSTILLEALYNNSSSYAVLTDKKDKLIFENVFPSLWDERIKKIYTFKELKNIIDKFSTEN